MSAPAATRVADEGPRDAVGERTSSLAARTWPSVLAGVTAVAVLAFLAFHAGGYFATASLPAGAAACGAVAVVLALRPPVFLITSRALLALGALGALAAWTALSTAWSLDVPAGIEDAQRMLTYVALFALGLLAAGSGRLAGPLVRALLGLALVVVAVGVAGRLVPERIDQVPALGYRLSGPLTYWNAFGALAALTAVLATGLAAAAGTRPALRGLWAAGGVLAATGMYLSLSRGAWLALAVGVLVLLLASRERWSLVGSLALVGGLTALAVLRLGDLPALVDDPTLGSGQLDAGRVFWPQLVGLLLLAGGVQWLAALLGGPALGWRSARLRARARRTRPWLAGGAVLLALATYGVASARMDGGATRAADRATGWVSTQWRDFLSPAPTAALGTDRLTTARGTRSDVYRVALDGAAAHPLAGDGAGSFRVRWAHDRRVDEELRNAHSLYLETLSDTGALGLLLLLAFLGAVVLAGWRTVRRIGALTRPEGAAVCAAVAVWAAHAAIDWDWQVPALTGLVLVLAATLFPLGRSRPRTRERTARAERRAATRGTLGWRAGALAALALSVLLASQARDVARVREATGLLADGRYAAATAQASGVRSAPARLQADLVAAYAARDRGDRAQAERRFAAATRTSPNDWAIRADRAENLLALGDRGAARAQLGRALALNPKLVLPAGFRS